ncbi:hypothetical protein FGRMN_8589 [Fusarium graminum]|nr:hypothetical protein FGRMN_8589 [Fusarium graminum]
MEEGDRKDGSQTVYLKKTHRKPATKSEPKQTKRKPRPSRKNQCNQPLEQSHEGAKSKQALQDSVTSIMFAQGCEIVPGFGLSIPFDGNRVMVLPFDEMPPSLQNFAFNDPACQQQAILQDFQMAPDISNSTHGVCIGNDQCPNQSASFAGALGHSYNYQDQVTEMGDETRSPNLSMFPHGQYTSMDFPTVLYTFKASSSPEINAPIKKHGATDTLSIQNVSYFTNQPVKDMDEISVKSMRTGVRYIEQALKDNIGLTESEYIVLTFWAAQLGGATVHFLISRAHTIVDARGNGPFSGPDLDFICFMSASIYGEVVNSNQMLADFAKTDGRILDLA